MRGMRFEDHGGYEELALADAPASKPGEGGVLLGMGAAAFAIAAVARQRVEMATRPFCSSDDRSDLDRTRPNPSPSHARKHSLSARWSGGSNAARPAAASEPRLL